MSSNHYQYFYSSSQGGINYWPSDFFLCFFFRFVIFFLCAFFFGLVSLSMVGILPDVRAPLPWEGWPSPTVGRTKLMSAPVVECLPRRGPLALKEISLEGKRHSPSAGCQKSCKGHASSSPFQVDRKHPSGVPAVLFPFFREDILPVPPQSASDFPLPEKTPRPMRS